MRRLSRSDVIRKAVIVFESIRRMSSKGGAGLEAERGAEDQYDMVDDCTAQLKEILREMEDGEHQRELQRQVQERYEKILGLKDWQKEAENGPPERLDLK